MTSILLHFASFTVFSDWEITYVDTFPEILLDYKLFDASAKTQFLASDYIT